LEVESFAFDETVVTNAVENDYQSTENENLEDKEVEESSKDKKEKEEKEKDIQKL